MSTSSRETPSANMAQSGQSATDSIAAKQAAFSDARDEPEGSAIRRELGLRPHVYGALDVEGHPDRRPCPPWCWVGNSDGEYDHEVSPESPLVATHTTEGTPKVVAELYRGDNTSTGGRQVRAATIEPRLEQIGQADPTVHVHLRHYADNEHHFDALLHLSLTDAEELAVALNYLVRLAR